MIKALILISLFVVSVWGYDPTAYVNSQENYIYSSDPSSIKMRNDLNSELLDPDTSGYEPVQKDSNISSTQKQDIVNTLTNEQRQKAANQNKYFLNNFVYDDTGLYCPPLNPDKTSTHIVILDSIDFNNGSVTCTVAEKPLAFSNLPNDVKNVTPFQALKNVETKTFTNPKYQKKLQEKADNIDSNLISPEAREAANLYAQKMQLIKQTVSQKIAGNVETSASGSVYLNLSQIIDAVMVFDQSIIDIKSSVEFNDIVLKPPYVQSYKAAHIREKIEANNKLLFDISNEFNQMWDALPVYFDPKSPSSLEQKKSDAYQVLGSGLNKLLFFIVYYYDTISWAVNIFLFGAILFAIYNVSHYFFERMGNENERKNIKFKAAITGTTAVFLLFMTSTDVVYTDDGGAQVELSILQGYVGALSRETGAIADKLAAAIIDSHSGGMFTNSSVLSPAEVERIAQDKQKTEMIREYQANHMPRCYNAFDADLLKSSNPEAYKNNAFVFTPDSSLKSSNISPYNTVANGGYVKNENFATSSLDSNKYSLNACNQIERDYKSNLLKLNLSNRKIEHFNNIELHEKNFEGKQAIMEKIWLAYQQYGYVALPLIAVQDVYEKVWELPHKKSEQYLSLLSDFDMKESLKFVSENILLHYAIGGGIDEWSGDKYKIMTDAVVGWIPFGIGSALSSAGSGAMGFITSILAVDTLVELVTAIRGLFIFAISTIMLFMMFIAKFIVFWQVLFYIVYVFMAGSVEKTSRLVVKTILTFFNPLILIFVVFITLFVVDFFHNVLYLFLEEMAVVLSGNGGWLETPVAYTLKGAGQIFAIFIEFLVSFLLVTKGTKSIYAFFEQNSNDISDVVSDGIASTIQNKVVK